MEMFAWETLGKKTFKGSLPDELFKPTKTGSQPRIIQWFFIRRINLEFLDRKPRMENQCSDFLLVV
jgi:hypothetical protein